MPFSARFSRLRPCHLLPPVLLAAAGGCVFIPLPQDVHAGPGRSLCVVDAETGKPLTEATVLVERYRVEGAMEKAPVIVLREIEPRSVGPDGCYRLERRIEWQRMWVVWLPEARHGPVREVVGLKVFAPGYETVSFAVKGPLDGLDIEEQRAAGPQGGESTPSCGSPRLLLRPLRTAAEREEAIATIARHGWPPRPRPVRADLVVLPEVRRRLARIMVRRYEAFLAAFPDYPEADRVRADLDRWRRVLGG